MRCFIAIDIDTENKAAMTDLQSQLIAETNKEGVKTGDVKWVKPANIHLTLKFLGEVGDRQIVDVCNIVRDVANRHKSFNLKFCSVGFFGGRSVKVLWVGTREGENELTELQKDLEQQLAQAGWPQEQKKFSGHLTMCRVKNAKAGVKLAKISEKYENFDLGMTQVNSVVVYQSQLTPKGPVYTAMDNCRLIDGK